ncbi:MAG: chromosome segregation protein [Actinomycetota bacterium]
MHLKSITLKGFKSFAQPTSLAFEPGITCVVGPNGSGKSNVVDALAWVMGEQGAKTLRGGKMEDVIFAGTATKGPLGRAEVQLTIDNSDGALPIEYSEVTISRVLFRNGASEYAINGEQCRLLDVQELLSDSGLGREMHVIVGQGQLDTVLRATPIERRALIEEAAGILKYRRRKEKTERKLEAMQVNLVRLQDLTAELRRNLKPLGRQAEVARQAQQIASIAREAKAKLLAHQIKSLRSQLEIASKSEGERKAESAMAQQQLASARAGIQELESQLVSAELDDKRKRLYGLESQETKLRSLQNIAQQRISLLSQQEISSRDIEIAEITSELTKSESELAALETEIEALAVTLRAREGDREAAGKALSEHDAQQLRLRSEAEAKDRERNQVAGAISVQESKIEGFGSQLASIANAIAEAGQRAAELGAQQQELAPTAESSSDDALRVAYEKAQAQELELRSKVDAARDALHAAERERDAVAAKHAALGLTLEQADGSNEVRKAKLAGIKGLLAESVSIDKGYEVAIAVALGALSDAVVATNREQAVAALQYLRREGLGRADFVVVSGESQSRPKTEVAGLVPAGSVVKAPEAVLTVLDPFLIAPDLESAVAALAVKPTAGKSIITLDGDLVSESLVRGGGTKAPSKLELTAERESASEQLSALAKTIEKLTSDLDVARNKAAAAGQEVRSALATLQQHDAELAARAERVGRIIAQHEAAKAEVVKLERDSQLIHESKSLAEAELESLKAKLAQMPAVQVAAENEAVRQDLATKLEAARQAELEVRISVGTISERRIAASKQVATLKGRLSEANAAMEKDRQVLEQRSKQLSSAQSAMKLIPLALSKVEVLSGSLRVQVRDLEAQRIQRTDRLAVLRQQANQLEQRFNELNQGVHEVEMQNHELRLNLANLTERVSAELALDVDTLLAETVLADETREELEKELRSAEQKLNQLGAFNPLALEEFAALEERHKYLSEQLEDLGKARADLVGIIKDLDTKMQHIFAAAFEDTKREFEKVFPILFPGGTGSISLTEPENLLETGVEVSVRPVGKRIERMSLLSGGERSLAAVALLIAIFKARPSPFYVLDEVEAALDDANLGRLLDVIDSLRSSSQLIIVTHQKRTMEIADALYGVSMRQDGMSQVVGQKLDQDK